MPAIVVRKSSFTAYDSSVIPSRSGAFSLMRENLRLACGSCTGVGPQIFVERVDLKEGALQ